MSSSQSPPRRLLVFSPLYPPHVGGLQNHAEQFNHYFVERGFKVTVFTPRLPLEAKNQEFIDGVEIYRFPAWEMINNYPIPKIWQAQFWSMWSLIRQNNYDVVISRTRFFTTTLLALFYSRKKGISWMHIEHGSDFVQHNNTIINYLSRLYDFTVGRFIFVRADVVVANSAASARFVNRFTDRIVTTIVRGVKQDEILAVKPEADIKRKLKGKIIITYLGRIIDGKGLPDLITAVNILNLPNIHLNVIGDGPQLTKIIAQARSLRVDHLITFYGQQTTHRSMALLKASDICVNPSYTEGLPTAVIEAALCRCAIVATDVGGTNEIIADNFSGLLIPRRQPPLIAQALSNLISDSSLRNRLAQNAYDQVINKYSWDRSIDSYITLIESLKKFRK